MSGEKELLSTAYLMDFPQHLSVVAKWIFDEWGYHNPLLTLKDYEDIIRNQLVRDTIPLTIIAHENGLPAGTASIYVEDMNIHPELSPWLAAVYVPESHRNKGIGSKLVRAIEEVASAQGIGRLYLWTPDKEHFYDGLGWAVLERPVHLHQRVVLMSKEILPT